MTTKKANRLADETSPYLLQHAHNPVDWHPWNPAALALAKKLDKPILLSIGYSACHWCHVMAHESFADPTIAKLMNDLFINIKVDREQRPDLDKIYQTAHQILNQRAGGWPLTIFLNPEDHTPFFAGTYFPNQARHNMPSFPEVLQHIAEFYHAHPDAIHEQNQALHEALANLNPPAPITASTLDSLPLDQARQELAAHFDHAYGGFGQAPKFPQPTNLQRLLRHWAATRTDSYEDQNLRKMLELNLHAMAEGGLYDQLGAGFYRYCVDEKWIIPHFEKMLYDNASLIGLYADAGCAFESVFFRQIAAQTADWVIREMQSAEGGYWSTLDADSEGAEGRFYTWTPTQIRSILNNEEYAVSEIIYGLTQAANFDGQWHLNIVADIELAAQKLNVKTETAQIHLDSARKKLFDQRQQRTPPALDKKILTAWNGLMIKGMASAGRRLQRPDLIASAQKSADFIYQRLYIDQRLRVSCMGHHAQLSAYLDDYVFLMDGLLELLQAQWRDQDMRWLLELAEIVVEHFYDRQQGGFYFTADDHEALIHRPKPLQDEAIPSGNAVAANVFGRLGHLLANNHYLDISENVLRYAWQNIRQLPYAHCALLHALEDYCFPPTCIVIRGEQQTIQTWQEKANDYYTPHILCLAIPDNSHIQLPALKQRPTHPAGVIAYVCHGQQCQAPIRQIEEFEALLQK
ncbi:MAG: thioredoxin domain-containing protein [Gammaproteobacteria bacterium]|nr:thioredoxin domain-containing protein [Gammaproteobacteria bacterium]